MDQSVPSTTAAAASASESLIALPHRHSLAIRQGGGDAVVSLAFDSETLLQLRIDHGGVSLTVRGVSVSIEATETLRLEARRLVLSAIEDLQIGAGGNVAIKAAGEVSIDATDHRVAASPGRIYLRANDDVSLDGERILMNCDGVGMPAVPLR